MIARTGGSRGCESNRPAGFESVGGDGGPRGTPPRSGIAAVALDANAGHRATERSARGTDNGAGDGLREVDAASANGVAAGLGRIQRLGKGREAGEEAGDGPQREPDETRAICATGRGVVVCEWCGHLVRRAVRRQQTDGRERASDRGDCEGGARAAIRICRYANTQSIVTSVSTPTPGDIFISQERAGRRRGHPVSHVKVKARLLHVARAYVTVLAAVSRGARCARA